MGRGAQSSRKRSAGTDHVTPRRHVYLLRAADSKTRLTALFSSGFVAERSLPMLEILAIIAACSAAGRLISSPPLSVQALRCAGEEVIDERNDLLGNRRRIVVKNLLQVRGQRFDPFFVHDDDDVDVRLIDFDDVFRRIDIMQRPEHRNGAERTVDGALLQRRQHVGERHRHRRCIHSFDHLELKRRRQHANLHAFEFGEMTHRLAHHDRGRSGEHDRHPDQALIRAQSEHHVVDRRIVDHPQVLLAAGKQSGRAQRLVALIDADEKFRRPDPTLDRPELRAFDLPGNGAELARRIDFALDPAAGILLDRRRKTLQPFLLRIVERRGAQLHDVGLAVFGVDRRR